MKVSRDHTLYYHPYNHLSPQKMVAFTIRLCYSYMRCGVWRSLVARTAGGREVAGSNPVAPIGKSVVLRHFFLTDKDVCGRKMNCAEKTGRKLWGK